MMFWELLLIPTLATALLNTTTICFEANRTTIELVGEREPEPRRYHFGLFPSTGCYSHDVMMKQVGEQLDELNATLTWVQTYLYDFGHGEIQLPPSWTRLSLRGVDEQGRKLMADTGALIWKQNVPFDFDTPFNWDGIQHFIIMLQRHQTNCVRMLEDERYQILRRNGPDAIVLDHFLQECMAGLAHLTNASVVQYSNWPIADGYITSLNIPANPSSVPKTGTRLPSTGMTFLQRCQNVLFHFAIIVTRVVQMHVLDSLFAARNLGHIQVQACEARNAIYAGRSEFLFDAIRPINNRVKHFGSASNLNPTNYAITTSSQPRRLWLFGPADEEDVRQRRQRVRESFQNIDWDRIDRETFVLVSFGSVAQTKKMHPELAKTLLDGFRRYKDVVVWQADFDNNMLASNNITVPDNVILSPWLPVKELLAHRNIQYIICHGGINTVNELVLFGVPVLGVPLQGDQNSNLRRLVDLGSGEMITIHEMNDGKLETVMETMRKEIDRYWSRSEKLSQMVRDHRTAHHGHQQFWLNWAARNGKKLAGRKLHRLDYLGNQEHLTNLLILTIFGSAVALIY